MDKQTELKRLIYDFNYLVERLNKAETIQAKEIKSDSQFDRYTDEIQKILKDASKTADKIEKLTGRPVTGYESLHGINI